MKRNINNNVAIPLLEQRIIDEEYAKAILEKQSKLAEIRENKMRFTNIGKNGGII